MKPSTKENLANTAVEGAFGASVVGAALAAGLGIAYGVTGGEIGLLIPVIGPLVGMLVGAAVGVHRARANRNKPAGDGAAIGSNV